MDLSHDERAVLDRFEEKCRIAGGPRAGYMMRKQSIAYHAEHHPDVDYDRGLAALVAKDLLKVNEGGELYYLTAAGCEVLQGGVSGE